jgi:hypothetical protein
VCEFGVSVMKERGRIADSGVSEKSQNGTVVVQHRRQVKSAERWCFSIGRKVKSVERWCFSIRRKSTVLISGVSASGKLISLK